MALRRLISERECLLWVESDRSVAARNSRKAAVGRGGQSSMVRMPSGRSMSRKALVTRLAWLSASPRLCLVAETAQGLKEAGSFRLQKIVKLVDRLSRPHKPTTPVCDSIWWEYRGSGQTTSVEVRTCRLARGRQWPNPGALERSHAAGAVASALRVASGRRPRARQGSGPQTGTDLTPVAT